MKFSLSKLAIGTAFGLALSSQAFALGYQVWMSDQGPTTTTAGATPATSASNTGGTIRIFGGVDVQTIPGTMTPAFEFDLNGFVDTSAGGLGLNNPVDGIGIVTSAANWSAALSIGSHGAIPPLRGIHGMLPSPNHRYMSASILGGYVMIIDAIARVPAALFRVSGSTSTTAGNPHMAFFSADGKYLLVANQGSRLLERINLTWDTGGLSLLGAAYDLGATLSLVGDATSTPSVHITRSADAITTLTTGSVTGSYSPAGFSNLTPNSVVKQGAGIRPTNNVVCPIAMDDGKHTLVTLAGGGAFIVDYTSTPMAIVGEYDISKLPSAGCGGLENAGYVYMDMGTSGSDCDTSTNVGASDRLGLFRLPSTGWPSSGSSFAPNTPSPFTILNEGGGACVATSVSRDAHGMTWGNFARTYLHLWDRNQNKIRVVKMPSGPQVAVIDIAGAAACAGGDPTPDLGDFLWVPGKVSGSVIKARALMALRGPKPLSFGHAASGSCPGLGIVAIDNTGASGSLDFVSGTTTPAYGDDAPGTNRSDPHAVAVRVME